MSARDDRAARPRGDALDPITLQVMGALATVPAALGLVLAYLNARHDLAFTRMLLAWDCPSRPAQPCWEEAHVPMYLHELNRGLLRVGVELPWELSIVLGALVLPALLAPAALAGVLAITRLQSRWLLVAYGWYALLALGVIAVFALAE